MNRSVAWTLAGIMVSTVFLGRPSTCRAQQKVAIRGFQEIHYRCDTEGIQLKGVLTARTFYGPPGFGETPEKDAREKVLILKLTQPITVDPITDESNKSCWSDFPHLRKIQLFIFPSKRVANARKLVGKIVTAVGTLREGDAPSEHTKVIMEVKTLQPK